MLLNCFQARERGAAGSAGPFALELGIKDLVQQLELPQTVVSRLVATLVDHGYLFQNPVTRRYRLGLTAFTLGLAADPHMELKHAARPAMEKLARETGESVSLTVIDPVSGDGLCILSLDSPSQIKLTTVVGSLRPLHRGATRKVLLAHLPSTQQQDYLVGRQLPPAERVALEKELEGIARKGYAYSEEELDQGAFAIAAPILMHGGILLGGLAVLGPLFRHTAAERETWIEKVLSATAEIGTSSGGLI